MRRLGSCKDRRMLSPVLAASDLGDRGSSSHWNCFTVAETHAWPLGLLYTNRVIQQISDSVHVPQSGCCLPASL